MTIWTMIAAMALVVWAISLALGLSLVTSPQKQHAGPVRSLPRQQASRHHSWII